MRKENELLEKQELRNELIDRLEVLDQVGRLLLLKGTDFATQQQVADYYKTPTNTIETLTTRNMDELSLDGFKTFSNKEIKSLNIQDECFKIPNRGMRLFTKRAILRVGMLLQDSPVAKELRTKLLDIVNDAESGQGSIETIVDEINEEKTLQVQLGQAIFEGNMIKVIEVTTKINDLKNKRIQELEPKADYYDDVLNNSRLLTTTEIAKDLGISARKLNDILHQKKIQFKQSGIWMLYSEYQDKVPEYADYKITEHGSYLKWTEKGREWILSVVKNDLEC